MPEANTHDHRHEQRDRVESEPEEVVRKKTGVRAKPSLQCERKKALPPFGLFAARVTQDYIQSGAPYRLWDTQLFLLPSA